VISCYKENNHEQNGEQCAAKEKCKQHTEGNPKQNEPQYFSHGNPSKTLYYYSVCGIFTGVRVFFEK
jgi:hypothetical protein